MGSLRTMEPANALVSSRKGLSGWLLGLPAPTSCAGGLFWLPPVLDVVLRAAAIHTFTCSTATCEY